MTATKAQHTLIKHEAFKAGFHNCGISQACFLENEARYLEAWLKNQYHGNMAYMERNLDKRLNPKLLVEGTKSVISLVYNYFTNYGQNAESFYSIAKYAQLADYHFFLKERMTLMVNNLKAHLGDFQAVCFVDSAPILERAWAVRSGLGWIGKHSQLIIPKNGSYYFICQILTDLEPEYDTPQVNDYCKKCRLCVDACPTNAIKENKTTDARKCIAYLTIENKENTEPSFKKQFASQIFGCDMCLQVCPFNRFKKPNLTNDIYVKKDILQLKKQDWEELDKSNFKKMFKNTCLHRTSYKKMMQNISFINNTTE